MANIGAGETYRGYLVKQENWTSVDSLLKDTVPVVSDEISQYAQKFRYRYLSQEEITQQQMRGWLKASYSYVLFSSETTLTPKERDRVILEDGQTFIITKSQAMVQNTMFAFTKKPPHIMVLN